MKSLIILLIVTSLFSIRIFSQELKLVVPSAHPQHINSLVVDKQGKFMYTFDDSKCIMWNISSGKQLHTFQILRNTGYDLSPDGKKLIISENKGVSLFNTENGKLIKFFPNSRNYYNALFSHDGDKIICTDEAHQIDLINVSDLSSSIFLIEDGYNIFNAKICLLPNNQFCLVNEREIRVYDLITKQRIFQVEFERSEFKLLRTTAQILKNGNLIDLRTGKVVNKLPEYFTRNKFEKSFVIQSANSNDLVLVGLPKQFEESFPEITQFEGEKFTQTNVFKKLERPEYFSDGYFDKVHHMLYLISTHKIVAYDLVKEEYKNLAVSEFANFGSTSSVNKSKNSLDVITNNTNAKSIDLDRLVPESHRNIKIEPFGYCTSITGDTAAVFQYGDSLTIRNIKTNKLIYKAKQLISSDKGSLASHGDGCFFFSKDGKYLYYFLLKYPYADYELTRLSLKDGIQTPVMKFKRMSRQFYVSEDRKFICGFEIQNQNKAFVVDIAARTKIFEVDLNDQKMWTPSTEDQYIAVSEDRSKVLITKGSSYFLYDLKTKNLIADKKPIETMSDRSPRVASSTLDYFISADYQQLNLHVYNNKGEEIYKVSKHDRKILSIYFSANNKYFFTISEDNTTKAFETATGRLLGTLYVFRETNDFAFVSPEGRFDGTQDGMKKLYYLKNREVYPLEILFEKYYTPNLYARLTNGEIFPVIDDNTIRSKPIVKIQYAEKTRNLEVEEDLPTYVNTTGVAEITINALAPDDAVDEIRLFHNGKIVTLTTRNLIVADDIKNNSATKKYTVNLLNGLNSFRAVALNTQRTESQPDEIVITYKSGNNSEPANNKPVNGNVAVISPVDRNGTLHLIVIGINQYQNKKMVLNYALADATAFKTELEKDAKSIIANIKTYFVTDNEANKAGFENALNEVRQNAKPQDVFIFYYAGHGVIGKDKEFYLVPNDVSDLKNVQAELEQKGLPARLLQKYAVDIAAQKQLFILDACQSAGAFNEMLSDNGDQQKSIAMVSRSTGTHWMAASGAQQFANEFSQLGHGAFTFVLLEALKGSAATNNQVTVNGLKNYLLVGVPELMKKYNGTLQYPASYGFGNDFPVELIK